MKRAFFGGVHPKGYKELSREAAIVPLHPSVVSVAMSQHIGAPCQPLVKVGDRVTVGQKIGDGQGLCVPVHASVSGTVTAIEARPHPGGNLQTAIVIESDGRDTLCPTVKPRDPEAVAAMSAEDLIAVIREAGITGMGGAGFPTSVKLSSGLGKVDTVIVNGAECEPYITSDDRLMRETPERVVGGLRVVLQILQPKRAAIGIEQNKPEAIAAISAVLGSGIDLLPLHVRYPQGAEKQLIQTVTGRCVPPGGLPAHVGCAVFNAATCAAIYDAVYLGLPLVRRAVTVTGSAIAKPGNFLAPIADLAGAMALNVDRAWVRGADGQELLVSVKDIHAGDCVVVRTGNMIPLDGRVTGGEAMVNQSSMTGESLPVRKTPGSYAYAGTVVEEGECLITVEKTMGGGRYDRIVRMIEESEKLKSTAEDRASRLADRLVPYTLGGTALVWLFTRNITKTLAVLMVDFSCALKLAMPIAVLSAMRESNARHMSVKGGRFLEAVAKADTIVFDKTGTLTYAQPRVAEVVTFGGRREDDMLRLAACLEEHYPHSLANAVVEEARVRGLNH